MSTLGIVVQAPDLPDGTVIAVELLSLTTRETTHAVAATGATTEVDAPPAPLLLRAHPPDGRLITMDLKAEEPIATVRVSPAPARPGGGEDPGVVRCRLWRWSGPGGWAALRPEVSDVHPGPRLRWSLTLDDPLDVHALQVGGPRVVQRTVLLPPATRLTAELEPVESSGSGAFGGGHRLTVHTGDQHAEALLAHLSAGRLQAAEIVADDYRHRSPDDPLAAVVLGYYRLRTRADGVPPRAGRPDDAVIAIGQLLLSPEPDPDELHRLVRQAVSGGLPVYTEGLRALRRAVDLLPDGDLGDVRRLLDRYLCAADLDATLTTFRGDPVIPTPERQLDQPWPSDTTVTLTPPSRPTAGSGAAVAPPLVEPPRPHRFDLLFPQLQDDETNLVEASGRTPARLVALSRAVTWEPDPLAFGRFVGHDIALEVFGPELDAGDQPLPPARVGEAVRNLRTGSLDLDSVYGLPAARDPLHPAKLLTGGDDLPRNEDGVALIGDPRNDEHPALARLHLAFLRAHNALVDNRLTFRAARQVLRQHFQHLVLHDHLKRLVDPAIVDDLVAHGNRWYDPNAEPFFLPLEFYAGLDPSDDAGTALLRGYRLRVPTGQAIGHLLGVLVLGKDEVGAPGFESRTPLWFYVRAEARHLHGGSRLGPVGGTLLAEVLTGLILRSRDSILRQPSWTPSLPSARPGTFELDDLFRLAGLLPGGPAVETYVIRAGDTLSGIAQSRLGSSSRWTDVYLANRATLRDPDQIWPGQILLLPPAVPAARAPRLYTVRPGDTLSSIAAAQLGDRSRWMEIYQLNRDNLGNPNRIFPGTVLALPDA